MWNPFKKKAQQPIAPIEPKSREELVKQLKEISKEPIWHEESLGAMCYCPATETFCMTYDCDVCSNHMSTEIEEYSRNEIYDIVSKIRSLGYDIKVEAICGECLAEKMGNGEYVFDFTSFECAPTICSQWSWWEGKQVKKILSEEKFKKRLCTRHKKDTFFCLLFREKSSTKYHLYQSNSAYNYRIVYDYLSKRKSYQVYYGASERIRKEIDIIEQMTGLKIK